MANLTDLFYTMNDNATFENQKRIYEDFKGQLGENNALLILGKIIPNRFHLKQEHTSNVFKILEFLNSFYSTVIYPHTITGNSEDIVLDSIVTDDNEKYIVLIQPQKNYTCALNTPIKKLEIFCISIYKYSPIKTNLDCTNDQLSINNFQNKDLVFWGEYRFEDQLKYELFLRSHSDIKYMQYNPSNNSRVQKNLKNEYFEFLNNVENIKFQNKSFERIRTISRNDLFLNDTFSYTYMFKNSLNDFFKSFTPKTENEKKLFLENIKINKRENLKLSSEMMYFELPNDSAFIIRLLITQKAENKYKFDFAVFEKNLNFNNVDTYDIFGSEVLNLSTTLDQLF